MTTTTTTITGNDDVLPYLDPLSPISDSLSSYTSCSSDNTDSFISHDFNITETPLPLPPLDFNFHPCIKEEYNSPPLPKRVKIEKQTREIGTMTWKRFVDCGTQTEPIEIVEPKRKRKQRELKPKPEPERPKRVITTRKPKPLPVFALCTNIHQVYERCSMTGYPFDVLFKSGVMISTRLQELSYHTKMTSKSGISDMLVRVYRHLFLNKDIKIIDYQIRKLRELCHNEGIPPMSKHELVSFIHSFVTLHLF